MISNSSKVLLIVLISSVLLVTLEADNEDCIELRVRRNTNHLVVSGQKLRIDCPVKFCHNPPPRVTWYKIEGECDCPIIKSCNHIRIGWEDGKPLEGVSFLIFQKILKNDSGRYGCKTEGSVGHIINITVIEETEVTNKTNKAITNDKKEIEATTKTHITITTETSKYSNNEHPKTEPNSIFWMYACSAAGIGSFLIIVIIISVIWMQGCKGKSRKEKQTENKYNKIPLAEQDLQIATRVRYSLRGDSNLPPSFNSQ